MFQLCKGYNFDDLDGDASVSPTASSGNSPPLSPVTPKSAPRDARFLPETHSSSADAALPYIERVSETTSPKDTENSLHDEPVAHQEELHDDNDDVGEVPDLATLLSAGIIPDTEDGTDSGLLEDLLSTCLALPPCPFSLPWHCCTSSRSIRSPPGPAGLVVDPHAQT